MEYVEGLNLKDYMSKYKRDIIDENSNLSSVIQMDTIKEVTLRLLEGLIYLHENKIIHRDLKVQIILIKYFSLKTY